MVWEQKGLTTPWPLSPSYHEYFSQTGLSDSSGSSRPRQVARSLGTWARSAQPPGWARSPLPRFRLSHLDAVQHVSVFFHSNDPECQPFPPFYRRAD